MRPVAWWRSITAILARSRVGIGDDEPVARRVGSSSRACVISWPGIDLDHAHARGLGRDRERVGGERRRAHRLAHARRGSARASNGSARAGGRDEPAVLEHARGPEALEVVEQDEVGAQAGRDRAAVQQPVAARAACSVAISSASSARDPLRDGDPAHLVDVALAVEQVGLAVVGAERAVLRARTRFTSGSRSRRLRALDASRISTHIPRRRFSSASSNVVASWSERMPAAT